MSAAMPGASARDVVAAEDLGAAESRDLEGLAGAHRDGPFTAAMGDALQQHRPCATSPSMWPASFDAAPSTPIETGTPASRIARYRRDWPDASRMFERRAVGRRRYRCAREHADADAAIELDAMRAPDVAAGLSRAARLYSAGVQPNLSSV